MLEFFITLVDGATKFCAVKKIINIYNDIARKYGNFAGKDFQK